LRGAEYPFGVTLRLVSAPSADAGESLSSLCERGSRGERSAHEAIYRRFAKDVARWVWQLIGTERDLDDVVQETFMVAFRKLHEVKEPERLRSWLASIASNLTRKRYRLASRRLEAATELGRSAPSFEDPRQLGELEVLYEQLARMDASLREPWVLRRLCDEDLTVVADACCVSLATVKRRIAEADEWLERRLSS
jgi:RNA polymerase sigma-70 factor, ECF subfamily